MDTVRNFVKVVYSIMSTRLSMRSGILIIVVGAVVGSLYYYMMSSSLPTDSNCSFMANKWTDIGAFIVGLGMLYLAMSYGSNFAASPVAYQIYLLIFGTAIITEHVWQLFNHKF